MKRTVCMILAALVLTACGRTELYSSLSERSANEMIAVLRSAGIEADKRPSVDQTWSLYISDDQFVEAIAALDAEGYPQAEFSDMGELFRRQGFVSTPLEERARYVFGLEQELSRTLTAIDGVVMARVHLALPENDPLADERQPSSASVFIKHRLGLDLSEQTTSIKGLIVNSVEGLSYDNVSVALFPTERRVPAPQVVEETGLAALGAAPVTFATVSLAGGLIILWGTLGRHWRRRREEDEAPDEPDETGPVSFLPGDKEDRA